ncbi:pupal cuticle protein Edg-78E [Drosophila busckii]|uniref:pupal cuticle protein Edg-78E n=1 Tax=Drosophila busckii TaxID=30019 RepID=UPI00083EEAC2|nr:pupal cuticle protein Edg-78E [Drosophila busckii]
MYKLLLIAALLGCAAAAPADLETGITKFGSEVNPDGSYAYAYEQTDGTGAQEQGQGGVGAQGSFGWVSPEGQHIVVSYTADATGYHPNSDALPTPPPIPAEILRALQFIQEHPTPEEQADRSVRAQQF